MNDFPRERLIWSRGFEWAHRQTLNQIAPEFYVEFLQSFTFPIGNRMRVAGEFIIESIRDTFTARYAKFVDRGTV